MSVTPDDPIDYINHLSHLIAANNETIRFLTKDPSNGHLPTVDLPGASLNGYNRARIMFNNRMKGEYQQWCEDFTRTLEAENDMHRAAIKKAAQSL